MPARRAPTPRLPTLIDANQICINDSEKSVIRLVRNAATSTDAQPITAHRLHRCALRNLALLIKRAFEITLDAG